MTILELNSLSEVDTQRRFYLERRLAVGARLGEVSKLLCDGQAEAGAEYCQLIGDLIEANSGLGSLGITYEGLCRSMLAHDSPGLGIDTLPDPNIDLIRELLSQRDESGPL